MVVTPSCSFFWASSNSSISSWNLTIRTQVVPEFYCGCLHQWDHTFCFVSCLHYDMILTFCVTMAHWAAIFRKHQISFQRYFLVLYQKLLMGMIIFLCSSSTLFSPNSPRFSCGLAFPTQHFKPGIACVSHEFEWLHRALPLPASLVNISSKNIGSWIWGGLTILLVQCHH